jgi:hypothetical protein
MASTSATSMAACCPITIFQNISQALRSPCLFFLTQNISCINYLFPQMSSLGNLVN